MSFVSLPLHRPTWQLSWDIKQKKHSGSEAQPRPNNHGGPCYILSPCPSTHPHQSLLLFPFPLSPLSRRQKTPNRLRHGPQKEGTNSLFNPSLIFYFVNVQFHKFHVWDA